jgi:hypothetical protein
MDRRLHTAGFSGKSRRLHGKEFLNLVTGSHPSKKCRAKTLSAKKLPQEGKMINRVLNGQKGLFGKVVLAAFACTVCAIFMGCTSINYKYQDPSIPANEHAFVYFEPNEVEVTAYDDVRAPSNRILVEFFSASLSIRSVSLIPSGTHTFVINYFHNRGTKTNATGDTYLFYDEANGMNLTWDFLPNHFYYITPDIQGEAIRMLPIDITNISDDGSSKKLTKAIKVRDAAFGKIKD